LHVAEVSEACSSSLDPFKDKPILNYTFSMILNAARVAKIYFRLAKLSNEMILDRDFIGAIKIGLRFHSYGSPTRCRQSR